MADDRRQNVGCLGRLLQLLSGGGGSGDSGSEGGEKGGLGPPPFLAKDWLLSEGERSFLGVLDRVVAGRYRVMCKVRLFDVVYFRKGAQQSQTWRNKTDRQHLDFLLVTPDELRPVAAIELDDSSHGSDAAAKRDATKDAVLAAAGLPLIRLSARRGYVVDDVRAAIDSAVAGRR